MISSTVQDLVHHGLLALKQKLLQLADMTESSLKVCGYQVSMGELSLDKHSHPPSSRIARPNLETSFYLQFT
jgi:hypothetical protein